MYFTQPAPPTSNHFTRYPYQTRPSTLTQKSIALTSPFSFISTHCCHHPWLYKVFILKPEQEFMTKHFDGWGEGRKINETWGLGKEAVTRRYEVNLDTDLPFQTVRCWPKLTRPVTRHSPHTPLLLPKFLFNLLLTPFLKSFIYFQFHFQSSRLPLTFLNCPIFLFIIPF